MHDESQRDAPAAQPDPARGDPVHATRSLDWPRRVAWALLAAALVVGAIERFDAADRYPDDKFGWRWPDVYRYYVSPAQSLLDGRGFVTDFEWNFVPPPLQGLLIAGVQALPGGDFGAVRDVQAWLGIATIAFAYLVGSMMGGIWMGVLCAWIVALDPELIFWTGELLAEPLYLCGLFAFFALLVAARRQSKPWLYGACGVLLGLTSLAKSFPFLLMFALPLLFLVLRPGRPALRDGAVLAIACGLVIAPWIARNAQRYGHVYPISTQAGTALAQDNFAALDPTRPDMIYYDDIYRRSEWRSSEVDARFDGVTDAYGQREWNERDRAYQAHALAYIASQPLHFARNYFVKLYNALRYPESLWRWVGVLLGLPGLVWFAWREWGRPQWVMAPIMLYYMAFAALFHITATGRLNMPMRLLLSVFAAYAIAQTGEMIAARLRRAAPEEERSG